MTLVQARVRKCLLRPGGVDLAQSATSVHDRLMEDWVAVEVQVDSGQPGFFVTWGRVEDAVDPRPLEDLIVRVATRFAIGGRPVSARVCTSLQEAAAQPYFFEALLGMAQRPIPFGDGYDSWRRERAEAMEAGREIYFLGKRRPK
jgi:hypothetical protein